MKATAWYSYRLFNAAGAVLYVGSTRSLTERMYKHRARPGWGDQIARIEAVLHPTLAEALAAETADRRTLSPVHSLDRDVAPKDVQLPPGRLMEWVRNILATHGPLTATGVFGCLVEQGYAGPLTSATTTLKRLRGRGDVEVVGQAPSGTQRWTSANVYSLRTIEAHQRRAGELHAEARAS